MVIYGFMIQKNGTAVLSKMTRKNINDKWNIVDVETGSKKEIVAKCERLNQ